MTFLSVAALIPKKVPNILINLYLKQVPLETDERI